MKAVIIIAGFIAVCNAHPENMDAFKFGQNAAVNQYPPSMLSEFHPPSADQLSSWVQQLSAILGLPETPLGDLAQDVNMEAICNSLKDMDMGSLSEYVTKMQNQLTENTSGLNEHAKEVVNKVLINLTDTMKKFQQNGSFDANSFTEILKQIGTKIPFNSIAPKQ